MNNCRDITMNTPTHRHNYIDTLKGFAICAVIARHTGGALLHAPLGNILGVGANGVQLFFVISAMLAYASLERCYKQNTQTQVDSTASNKTLPNTLRWYLKKYTTLAPLFILATILSTIILGGCHTWMGSQEHVTIGNFIAHIFLIQGFFPHYANSIIGVEWYIGVLVIFYLIAPLLYRFVNTLERALLFALATILGSDILIPAISNYISAHITHDTDLVIQMTTGFSVVSQLPVLAMGIVAYFAFYKREYHNNRLMSYVLLAISAIIIWGLATGTTSVNLISRDCLFGLAAVLIIYSQSIHSARIFNNPLFITMGRYSYAIYLFHYMFATLYERAYESYFSMFTGSPILEWVVEFMVVTAVSIAVAVPVTKLINKLSYLCYNYTNYVRTNLRHFTQK